LREDNLLLLRLWPRADLVSGLPLLLGPIVLAARLGDDTLLICSAPVFMLMGKMNEKVAVVQIRE